MSKKPLYIELLTYIDDTQQGEEDWVNLADAYRFKLADIDFFNSFKAEISFLTENKDILIKEDLPENANAGSLQLSAQITEAGEDYLRSYKLNKMEDKDKFSTNQIMLLMFGIIAATVLLAFVLAYFFG